MLQESVVMYVCVIYLFCFFWSQNCRVNDIESRTLKIYFEILWEIIGILIKKNQTMASKIQCSTYNYNRHEQNSHDKCDNT